MSQDIFEGLDQDTGSADDPDTQTPVESSGVSCPSSQSSGGVQSTLTSPAPAHVDVLKCRYEGCTKTYKTKAGYDKHQFAHKVNNANTRMPMGDDFNSVIDEMMNAVLLAILTEPQLGEDAEQKNLFLQEVLTRVDSIEWKRFVAEVADPIIRCLTEQTKLLPYNKYEEAQRNLHSTLQDMGTMDSLTHLLKCVVYNSVLISDSLTRRLVYRISMLTLENVQIFVAKEMQQVQASVPEMRGAALDDIEKDAFELHLGSLLRGYFKKCHGSHQSKMWRSLGNCLKEQFIDQSVNSKQFLDKSLWNAGTEGAIRVSEKVIKFFLIVEGLLCSTGDKEQIVHTSDKVSSSIVKNTDALNLWFFLTGNHFSEENSLYLMKSMVSSLAER